MLRAFRDAWLKACTDGSFTQYCYSLVPDDPVNDESPMRACCLAVAQIVGKRMGLINTDINDHRPYGGYLSPVEVAALGITNQKEFADGNDEHHRTHGDEWFYPPKVTDMIRNHPTVD